MSGYHYTIDVIIALLLCGSCWTIWHWFIEIPEFGRRWYGKFIRYLDDPCYAGEKKEEEAGVIPEGFPPTAPEGDVGG